MLQSLTLQDMSDRELLLDLIDVADADEWALAKDLVELVGINPVTGHRSIACRLGWLGRYGAVERELLFDEHGNAMISKSGVHKRGQRWKLTDKGRAIATGKLNGPQRKALEAIDEDQMVVALRELGNKYRAASPVAATLARREWDYGMTRVNGSK